MDAKFVDILTRRFPSLTRNEIEQACLLVELQNSGIDGPLAYRMVYCACIDRIRKEQRLAQRFPSYDVENFPELLLGVMDPVYQKLREKEEWERVLSGLPYASRKLAKIAQQEANRFAKENIGENIWTRVNATVIRQRTKERFISWEWNHSEKAYFRARASLVDALRRNRRRNKESKR